MYAVCIATGVGIWKARIKHFVGIIVAFWEMYRGMFFS